MPNCNLHVHVSILDTHIKVTEITYWDSEKLGVNWLSEWKRLRILIPDKIKHRSECILQFKACEHCNTNHSFLKQSCMEHPYQQLYNYMHNVIYFTIQYRHSRVDYIYLSETMDRAQPWLS